jgi:hypothetical protein
MQHRSASLVPAFVGERPLDAGAYDLLGHDRLIEATFGW